MQECTSCEGWLACTGTKTSSLVQSLCYPVASTWEYCCKCLVNSQGVMCAVCCTPCPSSNILWTKQSVFLLLARACLKWTISCCVLKVTIHHLWPLSWIQNCQIFFISYLETFLLTLLFNSVLFCTELCVCCWVQVFTICLFIWSHVSTYEHTWVCAVHRYFLNQLLFC